MAELLFVLACALLLVVSIVALIVWAWRGEQRG